MSSAQLTRHFRILQNRACGPRCADLASGVARTLPVMRTFPSILLESWRDDFPFIKCTYRGETVTIATETVLREYEKAIAEAEAGCPCWRELIEELPEIRSTTR